jgi:putative ATP-binding cassette transporter
VLSNGAYHSPGERQLLLRFWKSARGFWTCKSAGWAWLLTVLLIATVLLQLLTQYSLNFWNRDFFNAIERKTAKRFSARRCDSSRSLRPVCRSPSSRSGDG